jgi:hypothetical protein
MIIKFSKDIELMDWVKSDVPMSMWNRYKTYEAISLVKIYSYEEGIWFTDFYDDLEYLNLIWNGGGDRELEEMTQDMQVDFVKNLVDNFLIKMSGLTAFL